MRLENWIDSRHLDSAAQTAFAEVFASAPSASILIDNFLRPEKFHALQRVFSTEGRFEDRYYLWEREEGGKHEKPVPVEVWRAAPSSDRASVERVFTGPHPDYRMGQGIITHFKFIELLRSTEFMSFLQSATGIRPATLTGFVTRIMVGGQYIRPHSDFWRIRDLCGVFYASAGWRPRFGGRFRHRGPGSAIVPIEPWPNRLLLFQPRADCKHDVEAITEAGAHWQRWAHSIWFGTPDVAGP